MKVRITYNPFLRQMKLLVDGKPLSGINQLTRWQTLPFYLWYNQLFQQIYEELNDSFELDFVGRQCEDEVLRLFAEEHPHCTGYVHWLPTICDSAKKRLSMFHRLCVNGLSFQEFSYNLTIYSDFPECEILDLVRPLLPRMSFCRVHIHVVGLDGLNAPNNRAWRLIVATQAATHFIQELEPRKDTLTYAMVQTGVNRASKVFPGAVIRETNPVNMPEAIATALEMTALTDILVMALEKVELSPTHPEYETCKTLWQTEPQTTVKIPQSIEYGTSVALKPYTTPGGYAPEQLQYRVSNQEVITIKGDVMQCVGTGETVVEVYLPGVSEILQSVRINAYRRNRIRELTLRLTQHRMCVGDQQNFSYTFAPAEADNQTSIKTLVSSPSVRIDGKRLIACQPGTANVQIITDNGVCSTDTVTVYPKLDYVVVSLETEEIHVNEFCRVSIVRYPEDAQMDVLSCSVEPTTCATYDTSTGRIYGKSAGSAKLIVRSDRMGIVAQKEFVVASKSRKNTKVIRVIIYAALILVILLYFFLQKR